MIEHVYELLYDWTDFVLQLKPKLNSTLPYIIFDTNLNLTTKSA